MGQQIFSSEASKSLGIGVSIIGKYAVILEARGYGIERGTNNSRIFRQNDLTLLSQMIEKITKDGITIEQAPEEAAETTLIEMNEELVKQANM
ncbi:hypothetical protein [Lederbergia citrea]|uniref:hypothetical protein n=1 Tax=Lederbergia citrea TaxID=2833581 RepID=UPI001BC8E902|nr:hypothetical protein [Lederbergia citrea]MBS4205318.1 hypothetical protein [Lederbergia citrea]